MLCRHCGESRARHVGRVMACFGRNGTIWTPPEEAFTPVPVKPPSPEETVAVIAEALAAEIGWTSSSLNYYLVKAGILDVLKGRDRAAAEEERDRMLSILRETREALGRGPSLIANLDALLAEPAGENYRKDCDGSGREGR